MEDIKDLKNENDMELTIVHKRLKVLGILFILFFAAISVRLFWIQVIEQDSNMKNAVSQKMRVYQTSIDRGQIYDRNLIPFTNRELRKVVCISTDMVDKEAARIISEATGLNIGEVEKKLKLTGEMVEIEAKEFNNEALDLIEKGRVKGVFALEKKVRYNAESLARHAIGYIKQKDNKGMMGIEKSMNQLLDKGGSESIVALVDSYQSIIPSLGFRKVETSESKDKFAIKLTLDYHIQSIAEDVMKKNNVNGSAVVMDVKTSEIIAMVSTPDFDPNNVESYLDKQENQLQNKAVEAFDLGSIFKTVVAAVAYENHLVDDTETFICEGEIEVNNTMVKCSTYKTHENRPITFKEAYALSCNTTFVKIGMRVGAAKILEKAKNFGFGQKQCSELLEEKAGYIPTALQDGIGNISIGQGKIQATPLQVTTMMAAIANDGVMNQPVLVDELLNNDTGSTIDKIERSKAQVVLNAEVANKLKEILHEVTLSGTGKSASLEELGGSSGKTSSAQTGMKNGEVVHGWFAGFVPADKPQYAITIFVYNGQSGGKAAAPLFREIAYRIATEYKPFK